MLFIESQEWVARRASSLSEHNSLSKPRIHADSTPSDEQSRMLAKTLLTPSSEPLNLYRVLVRYPELMKRVNALGGLFMVHGSLPVRERELVILRVARNSRCDYEFAQHAPIGLRAGLSERQIEDLGQPIYSGHWDESDLGLLRLADEVMDSLEVSNETWDLVSQSHDENQMMELLMLVGYYKMLAAFLKTVGVPLEEGCFGLPQR